FVCCSSHPHVLPSFPTRRSSDLPNPIVRSSPVAYASGSERLRLVDVYGVSSLILAILATIALAWPVNIPLAALAYKVRLGNAPRSEEHTSELQSRGHLVCRLLLE